MADDNTQNLDQPKQDDQPQDDPPQQNDQPNPDPDPNIPAQDNNDNTDIIDKTDKTDDNNNNNNDNNDIMDDVDISKPDDNVVIVDAKKDHDNAIQQLQNNDDDDIDEKKQVNDNDDELTMRKSDLSSYVSIKFSEYLTLRLGNTSFALYIIDCSTKTSSSTSWKLYLRYSDLSKFHNRLTFRHNRLCKKSGNKDIINVSLPQFPSKKQWITNKLDSNFLNERIDLLNDYMDNLAKYIQNTSISIQNLYQDTFEINKLYKYVLNDDIEMLNYLINENNNNILNNKDKCASNMLHYSISHCKLNVIKWLLNDTNNMNDIACAQLMREYDQYNWNPLSLSSYYKNNPRTDTGTADDDAQIYKLINDFYDNNNDDDNKDNDELIKSPKNIQFPAQYRYNMCSRKRKLWVFINPIAGTGKSLSIWNNTIKPFLDYHDDIIEYDYVLTSKQDDARDKCLNLNRNTCDYDGIVCIGGDGIIAEVLNGLYHNKSVSNSNKICITPIATGSGNALAKELDLNDILESLRRLLNGFEICIDAYIAQQNGEQDIYSFVSSQWGAISAIDLESESYRWMGAMRFTFRAVSEILYSTSYRARLYFKPLNDNDFNKYNNNKITRNQTNNDDNWWKDLPNYHLDDDDKADDQNTVPLNDNDNPSDSPLYPSDWVCISDEFGLLCVTNLQYIAEDSCMGGNDFNCMSNTLRLVWNNDVSRVNYASILLGLESGKHLDNEHVFYCDVNKVVIEPLTKGPPMDVDGERKPLKPLYVEIMPSDLVVTC